MQELISSFIPIIEQLAEIFNTSTQFIENNFMDYTLKYGKYISLKSIIPNFLLGLIFFITIMFVLAIVLLGLEHDGYIKEEVAKNIFIKIIYFALVLLIISTIRDLIYYAISPEMYSLDQLRNLIN